DSGIACSSNENVANCIVLSDQIWGTKERIEQDMKDDFSGGYPEPPLVLSGAQSKQFFTKHGGNMNEKDIKITNSHKLYMDGVKFYTSTYEQMRRQLELVAAFCKAINMRMGINECGVTNIVRGRKYNNPDE
ncbi:hypothetical protein HHI36_004904, partial [Cryptolaemus montrouzieri]